MTPLTATERHPDAAHGATPGPAAIGARLLERLDAPRACEALLDLDADAGLAWLCANLDLVNGWPIQDRRSVLAAAIDALPRSETADAAPLLAWLAGEDIVEPRLVLQLLDSCGPELRNGPAAERLVAAALERAPEDAQLIGLRLPGLIAVGEAEAAHALLDRLGRVDRSLACAQRIRRMRGELPATGPPPVRIALLSSFTVDQLVPFLDLEVRRLRLEPSIYVGPFNGWAQEIYRPDSGLHGFDPELVFLAVGLDDLVPGLAGLMTAEALEAAAEDVLQTVTGAVRQLRASSDALIVVHGLHSAWSDPAGIARGAPARDAWVTRLDLDLRDRIEGMERTAYLPLRDVLVRRADGPVDDPKLRHLARMRLSEASVREVAAAQARYVAPAKGRTRKCVVLDLDNTLWGGIVGEDGPDGIRLGTTAPGSEFVEFQHALKALTDRGILLAISSKNNPDDALEVIRSHPYMVLREESFSALRINWLPKSENLAAIAEELNIGLDSLVFLDDNPKERELVRQMLPDVLVPDLPADPARYRELVDRMPELQTLVITNEDRQRTGFYHARRQREEVRERATSLGDYLASLAIEVDVAPASASALPRIHQLFQRTNQFNTTTRRYDLAVLQGSADDPDARLLTAVVRDRFGDHGLVAAALVRMDAAECRIDSFLMSCRVIGYGVEDALLARIAAWGRSRGAAVLAGEFVRTAKNEPARTFFSRTGFLQDAADGEVEIWRRSLDTDFDVPSWIALNEA